jgi:hypothetical protein
VPWLAAPAVGLSILGLVVATAVVVGYRYGRFEAFAFVTVGGFPVLALYLLLTACETASLSRIVIEGVRDLPVPEAAEGSGGGEPAVPALLAAGFLVAGVLVAAVLLYASVSESDDDDETTADGDAEAARAAGEAAARIEAGGDLRTEIHRAWREMAAHLDVARPASSTPGEFAEAAIEAGLPPAAVRELTTLFEEVRYGGFEPTAERTRRARAALERIDSHRLSTDRSNGGGESGSEDEDRGGSSDGERRTDG